MDEAAFDMPEESQDQPWWEGSVAEAPSTETLLWAAGAVGADASIVRVRRLTGGNISSVHELTVEQGGARSLVVLRRYVVRPRSERTPDWVREEALLLQALESTNLPVPRLLAVDPNGSDAGGFPVLLMSRVPGRLYLKPSRSWIGQLAAALARIHDTTITAPLTTHQPSASREYAPPPSSSRPELWREAIAATATAAPPSDTTFIHGDFQHFNVLWQDRRLSGVVDWLSGSFGPPDIDVGHSRLNLAVLFSADLAEQFRLAYESTAGRQVDAWWDTRELLEYSDDWQEFIPRQVDGRARIAPGMTARVEELLEATLRRL